MAKKAWKELCAAKATGTVWKVVAMVRAEP